MLATQLQEVKAVATTQVSIEPTHFSQSAGLVVFYDNLNFAYLRVYRSESLDSNTVGIVLVEAGSKKELLLHRVAIGIHDVVLQARLDDGHLQFFWAVPAGDLQPVGPIIDVTYLCDEATRGFTGTMIGLTCIDSYRRDLLAHFAFFDLDHGITEPVATTIGIVAR